MPLFAYSNTGISIFYSYVYATSDALRRAFRPFSAHLGTFEAYLGSDLSSLGGLIEAGHFYLKFPIRNDSRAAAIVLVVSRLPMMLIVFADQRDWYKANWAFRQIASDIERYCYPSAPMSDLLESCQWYGTLRLDELNAPVRRDLMGLLALACEKTLKGEIPGLVGDSDGQPQYRQALSELLALIKSQTEPKSPEVSDL